ncbi:MAG TPA: DegV family protein [Syntrophomonadaceae bacterium]|nr:DegV family protein [Syntrophomonadaceae bacterium]HOQ10297.1 DegV family protein [Syntrophomonadaceae bacterium]HPU49530.1 DegV family protein [Syntrophomonadaceae bacterium]
MGTRIAQIVDSAGSIPRDILDRYRIKEVAFNILLGDQQYKENITITGEELYERMIKQPQLIPKTAVPAVLDWIRAFKEKYEEGYRHFIVTTIAEPLSASLQSANMAARQFLQAHPEAKIYVLSSNTCACGQAALEIKIAQLIEQGQLSAEQLLKQVKEYLPRIISLFSVNELTYMHAGGRIGGATAFLGKLINIKPVCEFVDGIVQPIKPVRCRSKALITMADEAVKRVKHAEDKIICVQHALCPQDADFLITQLREKLNYTQPIYLSSVGAVVGAHSGPGAIGIGIV